MTIVLTGELAKGLQTVDDTKTFILEFCFDKISDLAADVYNNLSDHIGLLS